MTKGGFRAALRAFWCNGRREQSDNPVGRRTRWTRMRPGRTDGTLVMIDMNSRAAMYLMPAAAAGLGAAVGLLHHPDEGERDATGFGLGLVATSVGLTALASIPKSSATRFNIMFNPLGSAIPAFAALGGYYLVNEALDARGGS